MNYTALQVRLIPTEEQAKLLRMHIGTRRYAYNFASTIVKPTMKSMVNL